MLKRLIRSKRKVKYLWWGVAMQVIFQFFFNSELSEKMYNDGYHVINKNIELKVEHCQY